MAAYSAYSEQAGDVGGLVLFQQTLLCHQTKSTVFFFPHLTNLFLPPALFSSSLIPTALLLAAPPPFFFSFKTLLTSQFDDNTCCPLAALVLARKRKKKIKKINEPFSSCPILKKKKIYNLDSWPQKSHFNLLNYTTCFVKVQAVGPQKTSYFSTFEQVFCNISFPYLKKKKKKTFQALLQLVFLMAFPPKHPHFPSIVGGEKKEKMSGQSGEVRVISQSALRHLSNSALIETERQGLPWHSVPVQ